MSAAEEIFDTLADIDLEAPEPDEPMPVPQGIEQASWYVRRLARLRDRMAENVSVANSERQRVDIWLAGVNGRLDDQAKALEDALAAWHRALLADDPKRRTIRLPFGKIVARKRPSRIEVDDDAFVPWAVANWPELVRVRHTPDKPYIREHVEFITDGSAGIAMDGEVIPGLARIEGEVAFSVDTDVEEVAGE